MRCTRIRPDGSHPGGTPAGVAPDEGSFVAISIPRSHGRSSTMTGRAEQPHGTPGPSLTTSGRDAATGAALAVGVAVSTLAIVGNEPPRGEALDRVSTTV